MSLVARRHGPQDDIWSTVKLGRWPEDDNEEVPAFVLQRQETSQAFPLKSSTKMAKISGLVALYSFSDDISDHFFVSCLRTSQTVRSVIIYVPPGLQTYHC